MKLNEFFSRDVDKKIEKERKFEKRIRKKLLRKGQDDTSPLAYDHTDSTPNLRGDIREK